jgi:TetR/AcrR family transcriptional regulator, transcriptional repressor for nem operon
MANSRRSRLVAEALAHGMAASQAYMTAPKPHGAPTLSDQLNLYLSLDHRDNLAGGCAMAASASEIGRQDEAISARLAVGFEQMVGSVQAALEATTPAAGARARIDHRSRHDRRRRGGPGGREIAAGSIG